MLTCYHSHLYTSPTLLIYTEQHKLYYYNFYILQEDLVAGKNLTDTHWRSDFCLFVFTICYYYLYHLLNRINVPLECSLQSKIQYTKILFFLLIYMSPKDHVHCGCRKETTAKIQYILVWLREAALFSTFKLLSTKPLLNTQRCR